jgi:hypothetical protein
MENVGEEMGVGVVAGAEVAGPAGERGVSKCPHPWRRIPRRMGRMEMVRMFFMGYLPAWDVRPIPVPQQWCHLAGLKWALFKGGGSWLGAETTQLGKNYPRGVCGGGWVGQVKSYEMAKNHKKQGVFGRPQPLVFQQKKVEFAR